MKYPACDCWLASAASWHEISGLAGDVAASGLADPSRLRKSSFRPTGRIMSRKHFASMICSFPVIAAFALFGADSGGISGKISAADGTPVDAALTLHDLTTPRVVGAKPFDRQFSSRRDGTFALANVPAAQYEICVDAPQLSVLDPCRWGGSTKFTVTAAGTTTVNLTVQRGYQLKVRVNDTNGLLASAAAGPAAGASASAAASPSLQMAVKTIQGTYENLRLQSADATGRNNYLVVPYNMPLVLVATGSSVALSDSNNVRYTNDSVQLPILASSGSTPPTVTFNVTTPNGTTPVGTTPVGTTPIGTTPIGTTPIGTTP